MEKFIKFFRPEMKSIDLENKTIEAVVSTKAVDRDGDVIEPEAFTKRLNHYKDHPVLLSSHNSYTSLTKQIGEAKEINIGEVGVTVKFGYYAGLGNDEADWAWTLAQKGIAAFSIGFIGHEYEYIKDETGQQNLGRKFTDIEIIEISQVLIPSNRGALQASRGLAEQSQELCVMAEKSFDSGELTEVKSKQSEKKHYSEIVLDSGNKFQTEKPKDDKEDVKNITDAIKQFFTERLK
jgi:HK97 family phage prohead protease